MPNWLVSLVLSFSILAGMLSGYFPLQFFDLKLYDLMTALRQRETPSPVVLIEIDRKSIESIGPWPWPRSVIADMVKSAGNSGAKAVGLNILYQEKDVNPGLSAIRKIRQTLKSEPAYSTSNTIGRIDNLLRDAATEIDQDTIIYQAVKPVMNVVLPLSFSWVPPVGAAHEIPEWLYGNMLQKELAVPNPKDLLANLQNPHLAYRNYAPPADANFTYPSLAKVSGRHGHIDFQPDSDGLYRSNRLLINYQDRLVPSFALQMALAYADKRMDDIQLSGSRNIYRGLRYEGKKIPTGHDFKMYIDFDTNPFIINRYSFADVAEGKMAKGLLDNKLVLIGITDPQYTPTYRTPVGKAMTGVELTAYTLENIINNGFIYRPGWGWFLEVVVLLYFGVILLNITKRLNASIAIVIISSFLVAWLGGVLFMYLNNGMWFYVVPHAVVVILGFLLQLLNRFLAAPGKKMDEHTEMNKMLGLSFQGQGQLDMAFDSFRKCSLNDPSVKEALYNLGLDFERKRMFNKAISVYEYLLKGGKFKDANDRIWRMKRAEAKLLGPSPGQRAENNILFQDTQTKPTLGRYEIIKEIGKGAIGTVYLGRDPKINRKVAIKTLRYDDIDAEQLADIKARFFREAEAAGRLSHPNIVTIYDAGEEYDTTYMAMEYLDGHDLARHCRKDNLLPPKMILNIIIRVAFALDYAHKHKVVHRDIKPANVMLTEKGHVKVTDFGIARLTTSNSTQTGIILGTPNYMSPEQVLGKKLDGRSDLFSLGSVMYELFTGEKPFKSDNIGNLMHNIASAKFTPVKTLRKDIPPCCEALINKLMARSRAQRFQNAGAVVLEAQQCLENI